MDRTFGRRHGKSWYPTCGDIIGSCRTKEPKGQETAVERVTAAAWSKGDSQNGNLK